LIEPQHPWSHLLAHQLWSLSILPQAVFEQISRLNHACHPSTLLGWDEARGEKTCHAARDIQKGEELTVAYWEDECCDGAIRAERQARMHQRFGFACLCKHCELSGAKLAESDERQRQIRQLAGRLKRRVSGGGGGGRGGAGGADRTRDVAALEALLAAEHMPASWAGWAR
jgi:hypothetical protein